MRYVVIFMTAGYRYPVLHTHTHTRYVPVHTDPQKLYPAIYLASFFSSSRDPEIFTQRMPGRWA